MRVGGKQMAINMMCMNSKCKFYWENCCTQNMDEKRIVINANGTCTTFEAGVSDWYRQEENCKKLSGNCSECECGETCLMRDENKTWLKGMEKREL
jgi:hypothetical protein